MRTKIATRLLTAFAAAAVLGTGLAGAPAMAAQKSNTFLVSANVAAVCTITTNDLAFGAYDPSVGNVDASTTVDIVCTPGTTYDVGLDGGGSGSVAARQMASGGSVLNYGLYQDATRTTNWGDTVGTDTVAGVGGGGIQNITVYGRVPTSQFVTPGVYNDTVTATVTY
jgi:spore coat protein U-like protein